jgi:hypothetical protein
VSSCAWIEKALRRDHTSTYEHTWTRRRPAEKSIRYDDQSLSDISPGLYSGVGKLIAGAFGRKSDTRSRTIV